MLSFIVGVGVGALTSVIFMCLFFMSKDKHNRE